MSGITTYSEVAAMRVAAVFDAVDENGQQYFSADRRRVLDAAEQERLAAYLASAPMVVRVAGFEVDPLDPARGQVVPLSYLSDGTWVWQEASAYYLRTRGVAPDDDLVSHIESVGYRVPESLPDDVVDAAAELALSAAPEPATGRRAATYFASIDGGYSVHDPKGLMRQWRDEQGYRHDEALVRKMKWQHSGRFVANSRSGEYEFEEIPAKLAADIADRWWAQWRTGRAGS